MFSRGDSLLPSVSADARYIDAVVVSKAIVISDDISEANKKKLADKVTTTIKKAMKTFPEGSLLHEAAAQCYTTILEMKNPTKAKEKKDAAIKADSDAAAAAQPLQGSVSDIKESNAPVFDGAESPDGNSH